MTAVKTHTSCVAQTIAPARTIAVGKFIRDLLAQASNQEPTSGGLPREKRRGPPEERCRRSFRLRRLSRSASSLRTLSFSLSLHTNRGSFRFRTIRQNRRSAPNETTTRFSTSVDKLVEKS